MSDFVIQQILKSRTKDVPLGYEATLPRRLVWVPSRDSKKEGPEVSISKTTEVHNVFQAIENTYPTKPPELKPPFRIAGGREALVLPDVVSQQQAATRNQRSSSSMSHVRLVDANPDPEKLSRLVKTINEVRARTASPGERLDKRMTALVEEERATHVPHYVKMAERWRQRAQDHASRMYAKGGRKREVRHMRLQFHQAKADLTDEELAFRRELMRLFAEERKEMSKLKKQETATIEIASMRRKTLALIELEHIKMEDDRRRFSEMLREKEMKQREMAMQAEMNHRMKLMQLELKRRANTEILHEEAFKRAKRQEMMRLEVQRAESERAARESRKALLQELTEKISRIDIDESFARSTIESDRLGVLPELQRQFKESYNAAIAKTLEKLRDDALDSARSSRMRASSFSTLSLSPRRRSPRRTSLPGRDGDSSPSLQSTSLSFRGLEPSRHLTPLVFGDRKSLAVSLGDTDGSVLGVSQVLPRTAEEVVVTTPQPERRHSMLSPIDAVLIFQSRSYQCSASATHASLCLDDITLCVTSAPRGQWLAALLEHDNKVTIVSEASPRPTASSVEGRPCTNALPCIGLLHSAWQDHQSHLDILCHSAAKEVEDHALDFCQYMAEYAQPLWNMNSMMVQHYLSDSEAVIQLRVVSGPHKEKVRIAFQEHRSAEELRLSVPLVNVQSILSVLRKVGFIFENRGEYVIETRVTCEGLFASATTRKITVYPSLFVLTDSHIDATDTTLNIGDCVIIRRKDIQALALTAHVRRLSASIFCETLRDCDDLTIEGHGLNWERYPLGDGVRTKGVIYHDGHIIAHTTQSEGMLSITMFDRGRSVIEGLTTIFRGLLLKMNSSYDRHRSVVVTMQLPLAQSTVHTSHDISVNLKLPNDALRFQQIPRSVYYHGRELHRLCKSAKVSGSLAYPCFVTVLLRNADVSYDAIGMSNTKRMVVHDGVMLRLQPTRCRMGTVEFTSTQTISAVFDHHVSLRQHVELFIQHINFSTDSSHSRQGERAMTVRVNEHSFRLTILVFPPLLETNFVSKMSDCPALYIEQHTSVRFLTESGQCAIFDGTRAAHRDEALSNVTVTLEDPTNKICGFDIDDALGLKISSNGTLFIGGRERGAVHHTKGKLVITLQRAPRLAHKSNLRRDLALILRHTKVLGLVPGATQCNIHVEDHVGSVESSRFHVVVHGGVPEPYFSVSCVDRRYRQQSKKSANAFEVLLEPVLFLPHRYDMYRPVIIFELVGGGFGDDEDILSFLSPEAQASRYDAKNTMHDDRWIFDIPYPADGVIMLNRDPIAVMDRPTSTSLRFTMFSTIRTEHVESLLGCVTYRNDDQKVKQGVRTYGIRVHHYTKTGMEQPVGKLKVNISVSGPLLWAPVFSSTVKFIPSTMPTTVGQSSIPVNSKIIVNTLENEVITGSMYVQIASGYAWDTGEDNLLVKFTTPEMELGKDGEVLSVQTNHKSYVAKVVQEDNRLTFVVDPARSRITGRILQTLFRSVHYDNVMCSRGMTRVIEFGVLEEGADSTDASSVQTSIAVGAKMEPTYLEISQQQHNYVLTQHPYGMKIADGATVTTADTNAFGVQSFYRVEIVSQPSPTDALTITPVPGTPLVVDDERGVVTWYGREVAQIARGRNEGLGKSKFQLTFVGAPVAAVEAIVQNTVFHTNAKKDRFPVKKIQFSLKAGQYVSTARALVTVNLHELLIDAQQTMMKTPAADDNVVNFSQHLRLNPNLSYSEATLTVTFTRTPTGMIMPNIPTDTDEIQLSFSEPSLRQIRNDILLDKAPLARIQDQTSHSLVMQFTKGRVTEKNALVLLRSIVLETAAKTGKTLALKVVVNVPQIGQSEATMYVALT